MRMRLFLLLSFAVAGTFVLSACGGTQIAPSTPTMEAPTAVPTEEISVDQALQQIKWPKSTNQFGSTTVQIQLGGKVIYLDPVDLVSIDTLPKADIILITHDHGDHFSLPTISALTKEDTQFIVVDTPVVTRVFKNSIPLKPGATTSVGDIEIQGIPAYNDGHPQVSGYLGFLITYQGLRIYCSGDTGLTPEMEALSDIDVAILNLNVAYVLSGADIVEFAETVKPRAIIPIHWIPESEADNKEIDIIREGIPETTRLVLP